MTSPEYDNAILKMRSYRKRIRDLKQEAEKLEEESASFAAEFLERYGQHNIWFWKLVVERGPEQQPDCRAMKSNGGHKINRHNTKEAGK